MGALLGTGLLAAPAAAFASPAVPGSTLPGTAPAATAAALEAASNLAGGDEYIGMVKLLTGTSVPAGWALCDGQELPGAQYPALLAMLGATYGGDGRRTFALPDMRADMADMAALDESRPAGAVPMGRLCAIKVANAPATTTAVAELQMPHHYRRHHSA